VASQSLKIAPDSLTACRLLADDGRKIDRFRWSSPNRDQHLDLLPVREKGSAEYAAVDGAPVKLASYLKVGSNTTLNIILYAATLGRYLWLEGRVRRRVFRNWAGRFRYVPIMYAEPSKEEEVVRAVQDAAKVRVFGAGHSFNEANVSDQLLISLDNYSGLVSKDLANSQITVKAGTRVRDVVKLLAQDGLAFGALPSHDAQSIAGILSTDVHGTGSAWGFVSSSVVSLKVLDSNGAIIVCYPADDLFKAAIGGVGAVGIILEVTIQGVPRFNIDQRVGISDLEEVKRSLGTLVATNDHVSLYLFPFSDQCQVNRWNRTDQRHSRNADIREFANISLDALLAAWVGNLLAYTKVLPFSKRWSRLAYLIRRGSNLVLESDCAYNRTIYHLHQELEFAVPYEAAFDVSDRLIKLYEDMYSYGLPYTLFEVRFTPAGHDRTLIGAGRERHSTWIDIICNDSDGFEAYYAAAVDLIKELGGRPHLGKYCKGFDVEYLAKLHGEYFGTFKRLIAQHDPTGKFSNALTERLFGPNANLADTPATGTR
jgi:FAD/FMN-containing dehydrogenase